MKSWQAVFVDRDGTIGGTGHFIHPKDFVPYPFAQKAIHLLKEAGIKVFAFTNQHRISRGEATREDFVNQFEAYGFDQSYICPHEPHERCQCHKPKPEMLLQAAEEHGLDLTKCAVIGDSGNTDILAADQVRAAKILVRTGWGEGSLGAYRHTWANADPDYIAKDIYEAVCWLLVDNGGNRRRSHGDS